MKRWQSGVTKFWGWKTKWLQIKFESRYNVSGERITSSELISEYKNWTDHDNGKLSLTLIFEISVLTVSKDWSKMMCSVYWSDLKSKVYLFYLYSPECRSRLHSVNRMTNHVSSVEYFKFRIKKHDHSCILSKNYREKILSFDNIILC